MMRFAIPPSTASAINGINSTINDVVLSNILFFMEAVENLSQLGAGNCPLRTEHTLFVDCHNTLFYYPLDSVRIPLSSTNIIYSFNHIFCVINSISRSKEHGGGYFIRNVELSVIPPSSSPRVYTNKTSFAKLRVHCVIVAHNTEAMTSLWIAFVPLILPCFGVKHLGVPCYAYNEWISLHKPFFQGIGGIVIYTSLAFSGI
jgi:hypothetical protein